MEPKGGGGGRREGLLCLILFASPPTHEFDPSFGPALRMYEYTVTKAIQNEALLWKTAVLGMEKAPLGAGTFSPSPILVFNNPPCKKSFPRNFFVRFGKTKVEYYSFL